MPAKGQFAHGTEVPAVMSSAARNLPVAARRREISRFAFENDAGAAVVKQLGVVERQCGEVL